MNQLEDDLHRVLQLARAQSRLDRQRKQQPKNTPATKHNHPSRDPVAVTRHRHELHANAASRHSKPAPRTLLHAKLRSITALYGLENAIPKLSDCSTRATQAQAERMRGHGKPDRSSKLTSNDSAGNDEQEQAILEARLAARRDLYKRHYSGLQAAYGPTGLPKLECLLDAARQAKQKMARHSPLALGAAVLTTDNRIYASCTIESLHDAKYTICAERAALLKALGESGDEGGVVVSAMAICSAQQDHGALPFPCGACREFMADFGDFPVYLVNGVCESEEMRSLELFPRARQVSAAKLQQQKQQPMRSRGQHGGGSSNSVVDKASHRGGHTESDEEDTQGEMPANVRDWTSSHVRRWLRDTVELPQYTDTFERSAVDGATLLHLEDCDLQLLLGVLQPLHRRRVLLHVDRLKDRELLDHGIDYGQLQDYLAVLDRDRMAVVAELKGTFDRLDQNKDGFLDFREVRQALSVMHCDATPQSVEALLRGRLLSGEDSDGRVSFTDFAAAFSSLAMQPAVERDDGQRVSTAAQWQLPVLDISGLRGTFEKADRNKSGGIDEQELIALFQTLTQQGNNDKSGSLDTARKKARAWFDAADLDGDGRLSFAEFLIRYVQLTGLDISGLQLFFEASEPLESAKLKPMSVLKRALESFFPELAESEISVWYKRHLNGNLLRSIKSTEQEAIQPALSSTESSEATKSARTSLTISYADFVLAVFLFQNHTKARREQLREARSKLSNDALVHKSRIVHLQQTGHVRMCPQTMDAAKSRSLAEIRRNQQQQQARQRAQKNGDDENDDEDDDGETKCNSDDDDDVAAAAKKQKHKLARQLARVDATFDRFTRAKAAKKSKSKRHEEHKDDGNESENANASCELNAMEAAQAMTELGVACPRDQLLRLLKEEGFGVHDCIDRRDFRRLAQHFHAQSESVFGTFPAHRRPKTGTIGIWDEDAQHAEKMTHMAALLRGEYGKHRNREDYDEYLLKGDRASPKQPLEKSTSSVARKPWKKEMVRFHTEKQRSRLGRKKEREESKGGSSESSSSSRSRRGRRRGKPQRRVSRSRSRRSRKQHSPRRKSSSSSGSSFSSTETTESEREELQRHRQQVVKRQRGFEIGDRVFSRGGDGSGTLVRLYRDYFVADVHFDSGKKVKNVDLAKLKRLDPAEEGASSDKRTKAQSRLLRVGSRVAVSHKGTKTVRKGKVALCRLDGTFDVLVDELGEHETLKRVQAKHLKALTRPVVYAQGANVTVKQRHEYARGRVYVCRVDGTYDVQMRKDKKSVLKRVDVDLLSPDDEDDAEEEEDSEVDTQATKASTRRRRLDSDDNEEKDSGDDKYDDFEPEFAKGEKIEARFQGKEAFYPGKIAQVRSDGTFDVRYDDGDEEVRVSAKLIRAAKAASPNITASSNQSKTKAGERNEYDDDGFESS